MRSHIVSHHTVTRSGCNSFSFKILGFCTPQYIKLCLLTKQFKWKCALSVIIREQFFPSCWKISINDRANWSLFDNFYPQAEFCTSSYIFLWIMSDVLTHRFDVVNASYCSISIKVLSIRNCAKCFKFINNKANTARWGMIFISSIIRCFLTTEQLL